MTRVHLALHRLLRRVLPGRVRRLRGPDMDATFLEMLRHRGGWRSSLSLWINEAPDLLSTGMQLRWQGMVGTGGLPIKGGSTTPAGHPVSSGRAPFNPNRRFNLLGALLTDVKFAQRGLRRSPGFTFVAVLTIALGIGASVTVYSVVHAVLLKPLPYRDAHEVVHVWNWTNWTPKVIGAMRDVADYREWTTQFAGFASKSIIPGSQTLTGAGQAEHVRSETVTANFFSLLGVDAILGRTFLPEDAIRPPRPAPGETAEPAPMAAIISHRLWQQSFGADPAAVGRTVRMSGWPVSIIGVMPAGFRIVNPSERAREGAADIWLPQRRDPSDFRYGQRNQQVFARLGPGVTLAQAQSEMDAVAQRLRENVPEYAKEELEIFLEPALRDAIKTINPALMVLSGAVGFLLLLSCANVANLLLVRGRGRSVDTAIRAALGCGRPRLLRQMLWESVMIAVAGGVVGVLLTTVALRALIALRPPDIPRFNEVEINASVLVFAMGASLVSTMLFGLLPAIQVSRSNLIEVMKSQTGASGGGRYRFILSGSVVAGVALSTVLLIGAGLMVRTFGEMQRIHPGFEPERALTLGLQVYGQEHGGKALPGFVRDLEEQIAALPGVEAVGSNLVVPIVGGGLWNGNFAWDEASEARYDAHARFRIATKDYFRAMGIRLLAGRFFTDAEMIEESAVAIVDEAVARRAWPDEDPIGKIVIARDNHTRLEVVGVVESVRFREVTGDLLETIYWPYGSRPFPRLRVAVRTFGDPSTLIGPIRGLVKDLDPGLAVYDVALLESVVAQSMAPTRFILAVMESFAVIAVILAVVGLYGVVAFTVRQRTAEIGIRMALGAPRARILRLVFGQAVALIALGMGLGVAGALVLARFMESILYGVAPTDPLTLLSVAVLLGGASVFACCIPAWRGASTDPVLALRNS